jgi:hypothetical protein
VSRLIAYSDPPYIGQARKHYAKEAAADGRVAVEVDHAVLIGDMHEQYAAWALSCSSPSLEEILHLCREICGPNVVRVAAWVKPFASFKRGVDPAYAWEPIVYRSARKWSKEQPTCRDWVSANITLQRGVSGAKPDAVCRWLFELLGAHPTDDFHDIYPGSGAVSRAWLAYQQEFEFGGAA